VSRSGHGPQRTSTDGTRRRRTRSICAACWLCCFFRCIPRASWLCFFVSLFYVNTLPPQLLETWIRERQHQEGTIRPFKRDRSEACYPVYFEEPESNDDAAPIIGLRSTLRQVTDPNEVVNYYPPACSCAARGSTRKRALAIAPVRCLICPSRTLSL
jgi:hypothetical protein